MEDESKIKDLRDKAIRIFQTGLCAVEPAAAVSRYCRRDKNMFHVMYRQFDLDRIEKIYVIGAGKAGAPMTEAIVKILADKISDGAVAVKYGHLARNMDSYGAVRILEAGHPTPDSQGMRAARTIMELARKAGENDLVICLISGGGSALTPFPQGGLTLEDKQETTKILMAGGATIHEINTIRKHLSAIKGGRLAKAAYPAHVVSLILSDVVGDDPDVIASGLTVPDKSTFDECVKIIQRYEIRDQLPEPVIRHLMAGAEGAVEETPKIGEPAFDRTENIIIASNVDALLAAQREACAMGCNTLVLSSQIQGDTPQAALFHAAIAREITRTGHPVKPPACILSGGETTVRVNGDGLGGRNQHFAMVMAREISGLGSVVFLCGGTDGTDGPTDAAGGLVDSTTLARAENLGLDCETYLQNFDSYHFLDKTGDLLKLGPTKTNVMDLRVLMVG